MTTSYAFQYLVVAGAVLLSAGGFLHAQFPDATRRLRASAALPLLRPGRPSWLVRIGRWLAPPPTGGVENCGHCSGCDKP
ncbi:DUF6587 family protein [Luteimonas vadosa]|uniref:Uncharacterized protein n=1 Tax=Luteimonas vadosa TaxID=1165507 RepID=A0ABP9E9N4_9GAMM